MVVNKVEIKGKYGTAIVYATVVDETTKEQIKNVEFIEKKRNLEKLIIKLIERTSKWNF